MRIFDPEIEKNPNETLMVILGKVRETQLCEFPDVPSLVNSGL